MSVALVGRERDENNRKWEKEHICAPVRRRESVSVPVSGYACKEEKERMCVCGYASEEERESVCLCR